MRMNFDLKTIQKNIVIYGAQMVGVSVYYALRTLIPDCVIINFLVSDYTGNPREIDGVQVVTLNEFDLCDDIQVLIATPENYHKEIAYQLESKGVHQYMCITSDVEMAIMKRYYNAIGRFVSLYDLPKGSSKAEAVAYMSKFYKDRKLDTVVTLPDWVIPIQAGTDLTDIRVADICDNVGDNISQKNVNYCELSAMYWIARHVKCDYMGLFHYRRVLDIQEEDLYRIKNNDVDVVLPYPTVHYPNINKHHERYIHPSDWAAMEQALQEVRPEYAKALPELLQTPFFYNYNILLAKRDVFKRYCDWMFPVLERVEELSIPKGSERADRYIGYMGENLTTLFFMYHKDDFNIVHAGRKMFV